jgi:hypothetical protein
MHCSKKSYSITSSADSAGQSPPSLPRVSAARCVALYLGRPVRNLRFERLCAYHRLLQVGAVYREGQVGFFG